MLNILRQWQITGGHDWTKKGCEIPNEQTLSEHMVGLLPLFSKMSVSKNLKNLHVKSENYFLWYKTIKICLVQLGILVNNCLVGFSPPKQRQIY